MLAVSNTSPVFNLACIERLTLLHEQFDTIWIPSAVEAELRNVPDAAVLKIIEQARQAGWFENAAGVEREPGQLALRGASTRPARSRCQSVHASNLNRLVGDRSAHAARTGR
jgi:hypothetical protein